MTKEQKVRVVLLFIRNLWCAIGILAAMGAVGVLFTIGIEKLFGAWSVAIQIVIICSILGVGCYAFAKLEVEEDEKG